MKYEYKAWQIYLALSIIALITLVFTKETMIVPTFPTLILLGTLVYAVNDFYIKALRMKAPGCILESIDPEIGGHTTIHPSDMAIVTSEKYKVSKNKKGPSFVLFTTGGFVSSIVSPRGHEFHVICPPEHLEKIGNGYVCHTRLWRIPFEKLPGYVQSELMNRPSFDLDISRTKDNILFGLTSTFDETATDENRRFEQKWSENEGLANYYKNQAESIRVTNDKLKPSDVTFVPMNEEVK